MQGVLPLVFIKIYTISTTDSKARIGLYYPQQTAKLITEVCDGLIPQARGQIACLNTALENLCH